MTSNSFSSSIRIFCILALTAFVGVSFSACKSATAPPKASDGAKRYELKGKVVSADKVNHKVTIEHEEIKGYMEAMTMPFTLLEEWVYSDLKPGAQIQATLVLDQGRSWLENPVVTNIADPSLVGKVEETGAEPSPGADVPNFTLVNQDGKKINFEKYRNQALVVTFIYTRCPLPDYCPLMSQKFQQIQQQAQQNPALKDKTRLLSVSVDPNFDTPKVLRDYGLRYLASGKPEAFKTWEFATGTAEEVKQVAQFFGLNYWPEKDQIIHSLRTAIVTPDGKVAKVYRGNEWKPEEVVEDLEKLK